MTGIEFLKPACITVHGSETDEEGTEEHFKAGEKADADIFSENSDGTVDLQFGDGSVAFHISRAIIKEVSL
jgi:hypothetical protein